MSESTASTSVEILQPPALDHDAKMKKEFGHDVHPRGRIERRIVWDLLHHLERSGFTIHSVHDGDDELKVATKEQAMEEMFNLDDCHLFFVKEGAEGARWLRLVFGNGYGEECISDYGMSPVAGWNEAMEAFKPELFV